jgi:DNA-binding MarR family transcriptional regulator
MSSGLWCRQQLLHELSTEVCAGQRASEAVDELACELLGVNRTDGRCLDILERDERLSAGKLAAASGLTTGATTAVIDRLERCGYVRRVADPGDRRRVLLELTPKARQAVWEVYGPLAKASEPLAARYSDDELEMVLEFQRLGRALQERHADRLRQRLRERSQDRREV